MEAAPTRASMTPQQRTALLSVVVAAALVALKLVTGLVIGSLGLIAEALHSGTDLVAALLTFFAVRVAGRPPDRDHPFEVVVHTEPLEVGPPVGGRPG